MPPSHSESGDVSGSPGAPVLYSFRRCPYAMRARLALAISGGATTVAGVMAMPA